MDGRSGTAGAGWNEKIADGREYTDEPLQVPGQPEALHHSLSSTERQMRILRPIVEPLCERCSTAGITWRWAAA